MHERSAERRSRGICCRESRDDLTLRTRFLRNLLDELEHKTGHAIDARVPGGDHGHLMAFCRQIDSLLAAIDFLAHAISDDLFVLDEVFHESNVGVISHDDIGIFHGLDGLRRHFFFMARSNADDPDSPRAIATVALTNFVFGRSVFPFIDSINAAD